MPRCLIVDDDPDILRSVADFLTRFGMTTGAASNGAELRRSFAEYNWDVVILDIMLPDESGLDLCRWVRETSDAAVIMLTAQGDPGSRVLGLELGADDYLGKPFEPRELVARINAVLRRSNPDARRDARSNHDELRFDGWRFDRVRRQLRSPDDVVMPMSSAEFRLLSAFVERPNRVLSRDQLIEATRARGVEVNDRSIDLAVSRLRQKLGDTPRAASLIRTIRGEGYLFEATIDASECRR